MSELAAAMRGGVINTAVGAAVTASTFKERERRLNLRRSVFSFAAHLRLSFFPPTPQGCAGIRGRLSPGERFREGGSRYVFGGMGTRCCFRAERGCRRLSAWRARESQVHGQGVPNVPLTEGVVSALFAISRPLAVC